MQHIIIISTLLACAAAAPVYLLAEEHHVYQTVPLTTKSTHTRSSHVIDHGSTFVHTPVVHAIPLTHTKTTITKSDHLVNHGGSTVLHPIHVDVMPVHDVYHIPSKTTVTKSNQVVNHGGTAVVHAPIVTPVVYHTSPLVAVKTGDSAIIHHSSTVHETVPIVKSLPVLAVH